MTNKEAAEMIRNDMKLHHDYLSGQYRKALNMAIDALLKDQPEIIRCKDCKRRGTYNCPVYVGGDGMHSEPDYWYCADGERGDDDD